MMSELMHTLVRISWTVGFVILMILLLRPVLRRLFGSQLTYLAWSAVPFALVAALLPFPHAGTPMLEVAAPMRELAGQSAVLLPPGSAHWAAWVGSAWMLGCVAMLAWFWRSHERYRKSLGKMHQSGGLLYCADNSISPAVIGLWRHAIVVPNDFPSRYSTEEQRLILAHEAVHAERRDPLLNALCALIQCMFWFHPLVHLGARRFRLDQELACDATVMRSHPGLRRSYADAMLKTQLSSQATLIHCHWQSIHPLKERIMHLKQTPPRTVRRLAGSIAVAGLVITFGFAAMAAHAGTHAPAEAGQYDIQMQLTAGGETSAPRVRARAGEAFAVSSSGAGGVWRGEFIVQKVNASSVFFKTVFKHDDRIVGNPNLMVHLGSPATVAITGQDEADNIKLQLTVSAMQ